MARSDRVYDYRDLSQWSYDLAQGQPKFIGPLPNGWSIVDSEYDQASQFGAAIFRNDATKELVVSFRGTEKNARDWVTNAELAIPGHKPAEYTMAERYMEKAMVDMPEGFSVRTTGHSQGAGMAHYMGLKHDVPSVGFNTSPGNIYLNEIYKTLPNGGSSSHVDIRSSESGERGVPMLNSDVVSGLEEPALHPVGGLAGVVISPKFTAEQQFYMDPILGIKSVYLPTGCNDKGICHSLTNFDDAQLDEARRILGSDILPGASIIGGDDKFKACFDTRDVTEGVTLNDARLNEVQNETDKALDAAAKKASEVWDATTKTAGEVKDWADKKTDDLIDATKDAWEEGKDTAADAADWASNQLNKGLDAAKDTASDAWDWAKGKWNNAFGEGDSPGGRSPNEVMGFTMSSGGGGASQSIVEIEGEGEDQAQEADSHADRAEAAARRARRAARSAASSAARLRAMLYRKH